MYLNILKKKKSTGKEKERRKLISRLKLYSFFSFSFFLKRKKQFPTRYNMVVKYESKPIRCRRLPNPVEFPSFFFGIEWSVFAIPYAGFCLFIFIILNGNFQD